MKKDDGVSTTAAVILLIGITVLLGGVIAFAVLSAGFPGTAPQIPVKLTIEGDTGVLSVPEGYGIEQIIISGADKEYVYDTEAGDSAVSLRLPKEQIVSPAAVTAAFQNGSRTVILRI